MTAAEIETEEPQVEEAEQKKDESKAFDRVTDIVTERELDTNKVQNAMMRLAVSTREQEQRTLERDRELAKVVIQTEDVEIIASQFEMDKKRAERILREHNGDVIVALQFLVNEWPEDAPKAALDEEEYIDPVWMPKTKKKPLPTPSAPPAPDPPAAVASTNSASSRPVSSRPGSAKPKGKKKK
mmetsp:Transcript_33815/g.46823  ORF Transcript_33815/g.46823 Transcript_33815/m.46823 type:complete len:184 (+) Transcript_33815:228-779(+)|eukprot:CAMPEP_0196581006 /NCGR_PEP_ID=MMETSP1081-20130531/31936_1 /TAXON_ID=36882 /ORGANISM="Pyramimonas amylifera, Strain CCMP720" /LENGTH=183 /DNA_ID=CAMNT_0041901081 /DNA_START=232 /DNA_END=783 /DNA_ORIENTATION=+